MAATLDGLVDPDGAAFEAKFMLPWTFSQEAVAEKHMAQLQHNMWVAKCEVRSVVNHYWRRKVGRAHDLRRPALPAPFAHRREEVLGLRAERGDPEAVWGRAAATAAGSGPDRGYECVQLMGRVRSHLTGRAKHHQRGK
jgi:hypothetical protein